MPRKLIRGIATGFAVCMNTSVALTLRAWRYSDYSLNRPSPALERPLCEHVIHPPTHSILVGSLLLRATNKLLARCTSVRVFLGLHFELSRKGYSLNHFDSQPQLARFISYDDDISTMNSEIPFAAQEELDELMRLLDEDHDLTSAPYTAPETSLPHGSVGQNEFGQDDYSALSSDQYWQHPPPETLTNNSSYYDQEQAYTSGSIQPGQFVPGIYSPGGYEQVRLQYQHRAEPTVALGTST